MITGRCKQGKHQECRKVKCRCDCHKKELRLMTILTVALFIITLMILLSGYHAIPIP